MTIDKRKNDECAAYFWQQEKQYFVFIHINWSKFSRFRTFHLFILNHHVTRTCKHVWKFTIKIQEARKTFMKSKYSSHTCQKCFSKQWETIPRAYFCRSKVQKYTHTHQNWSGLNKHKFQNIKQECCSNNNNIIKERFFCQNSNKI